MYKLFFNTVNYIMETIISINHKIKNIETEINNKIAFSSTSTIKTVQSINSLDTLNFNQIDFCVPTISNYDTITKRYTISTNGLYFFGFSVKTESNNCRIDIFKNGISICPSINSASIMINCIENDFIDIRCIDGDNVNIFYGSFYGYLI